nr:MAG TPA: hypothetical protein [Caudoviricetes sp.]
MLFPKLVRNMVYLVTVPENELIDLLIQPELNRIL